MLHKLICLNPDLKRLQDEGYAIEVRGGNLFIHHIPYLNVAREMKSGILVMPMNMHGDKVSPVDHTAYWAGEKPYNADSSEVQSLINAARKNDHGNGIKSDYYLSCYPDSMKGKYPDFYLKVLTYFNTISAPARLFNEDDFNKLRKPIIIQDDDSPLEYDDTNASRAGIVGVNEKVKNQKIAIVGLGGTGAYLLDFLSKTQILQIHLYDDDILATHNAFRAPGAASVEELNTCPKKVEYLKSIYSKMHRGISTHVAKIGTENVSELYNMDFVFICIDSPSSRNMISTALAEHNVPFIDSGMGLEIFNKELIGQIRVTTGLSSNYDHLKEAYGYVDTAEDDVYSTNIQISELNALAAILSIIQWKRLNGIYHSNASTDLNFIYSVSDNRIIV